MSWDAPPARPGVKSWLSPLLKREAPWGLAVGPLDVVSALGTSAHIESVGRVRVPTAVDAT